jgi:hypothetical protein
MQRAQQSYEDQTHEWQCRLHLRLSSLPTGMCKGEAEQRRGSRQQPKGKMTGSQTDMVVIASSYAETNICRDGFFPVARMRPCWKGAPCPHTGQRVRVTYADVSHAEDMFEPLQHTGIVDFAEYGRLCSFQEGLFQRVGAGGGGQLGRVSIDHTSDHAWRDGKVD